MWVRFVQKDDDYTRLGVEMRPNGMQLNIWVYANVGRGGRRRATAFGAWPMLFVVCSYFLQPSKDRVGGSASLFIVGERSFLVDMNW